MDSVARVEVVQDNDGLYQHPEDALEEQVHTYVSPAQRLVLPKRYSLRLFRSSGATSASLWYAGLSGHWFLFAIVTGVLLCSFNYWRHPTFGWRRNLDMCFALAAVASHFVYSFFMKSSYKLVYYLLFATGISCYLLARHFGGQGKVHTSSSLHTGLHFIGNLSNLVLYAGLNAAAVRATFPFAASQ